MDVKARGPGGAAVAPAPGGNDDDDDNEAELSAYLLRSSPDAGRLSCTPAIVHQRHIADPHPHTIAYCGYDTAQEGEGNSTQIDAMRKTCYRASHVAKGP